MQNINEALAPPSQLIDSVDHALRLLLLFQDRKSVRVTDVAKEIGVARSTAHRLLTTLAWRGFVVQDRAGKAYRAGQVLVQLGLNSVIGFDLRRNAHKHLEELSKELDETVNLLVLEGDGARFIDSVEGAQAVRVSPRTGRLLPAYTTAGGKVLIADLTPEGLRNLYPNGLKSITEHTKTSFDLLEQELAEVRRRGYALNIDESISGLRALAVPVRDHAGMVVAALAVSTPSSRLGPAQVPVFAEKLADAASHINSTLN